MRDACKLPLQLYCAADVRAIDQLAIRSGVSTGLELMQTAADSAFRCLRVRWPQAVRLTVVCGTGNNAGDGYLLALLAVRANLDVRLVQLGPDKSLAGDALLAREMLGECVDTVSFRDPSAYSNSDVIVDAIFGTGLNREISGDWREAIELINDSQANVLSLDIPSGLDADTGAVHGVAVKADVCPTFVALKRGLFTGAGSELCGDIEFFDLGLGDQLRAAVPVAAERAHSSMFHELLAPRPRETHKGNCGHVLAVGGDHGFAGAVRMTAEAALRSGAGLVTVATREQHVGALLAARPELMCRAVEDEAALDSVLDRPSVIAIGPGMGRSQWSTGVWNRVQSHAGPVVVDADALNALAQSPCRRDDWVLTPHPGEAARLLSCDTAAVQANRFDAASELVARYGGVVVLKGAGTLVAAHGKATSVCVQGNPGMASGGMGDVLTGVIAALLAQRFTLWDAARVGVCLHSAAADRAAENGERGLLAMDLMAPLRSLVNPVQR